MPEDVKSPHPSRNSFTESAQLSNIAQGNVTSPEKRVVRISWNEITKNANRYVAEVKRENPDIPEIDVEIAADLLFGPFRMDQKTFNDITTVEGKRVIGAIQHNLTHALLDAQSPHASDEFVETTHGTMSFLDRLARTEAGQVGGLSRFLVGVRGEIAAVKGLHEAGWIVELPDYAQDTAEVPHSEDEVLQWDVISGIDLIARKDDVLLLVNAKGRLQQESGHKRLLSSVFFSQDLGVIPDNLRAEVDAHRPNRVKRATITTPTENTLWPKFSATNPQEMRREMASYGASSQIKDGIISGLRRLRI